MKPSIAWLAQALSHISASLQPSPASYSATRTWGETADAPPILMRSDALKEPLCIHSSGSGEQLMIFTSHLFEEMCGDKIP
jgi:hypothetical protein